MAKKFLCEVSGKSLEKDELYKFIINDEFGIVFDLDHKLSCNGIYISVYNYGNMWFKYDFFKKYYNSEFDIEKLRENILKQYHTKILTLVALAKKSGKLHLAKRNICDNIPYAEDDCVIIQSNTASVREKFKENNEIKILELYNSLELSSAVGKENINYIMVVGSFSKQIIELYNRRNFFNSINND
jgi:hypothetical protein